MVGEMASVRGKPRSASVIAFDDVEVLYLPAAGWLQFLYDHPRAMHARWVAQAERTEWAIGKIVESELAVGQQLAKALIELADTGIGEHTGNGAVKLRLSQQDLAAMIKAAGTIANGDLAVS
jgi:CRP-like cAMP-binding protein